MKINLLSLIRSWNDSCQNIDPKSHCLAFSIHGNGINIIRPVDIVVLRIAVGARGLWLHSLASQEDTVSSTACHRCDVSSKLC